MFKAVIFLLCISITCAAQSPRPSRYEIFWAVLHPFSALKVKHITKVQTKSLDNRALAAKTDSFSNGGKQDAFRHIYFMSLYAQKIKVKKLRKLGVAHEKTNYLQFKRSKLEYGELPDSLSSVMDLQNNELGFKIGAENKKLNFLELTDLVIKEITTGKALIMKRNKKGSFLSCDDQPLDLQHFKKKWNLPKCLVPSDFIYTD